MKKKGVVSLITFSLLLLIFLLIVSSTFYYYSDSKSDSSFRLKEIEVLTEIANFRSELLNLVVVENSSLVYSSSLSPEGLKVILNNYSIVGNMVYNDQLIEINISSFGVDFCSDYEVYLIEENSFNYNGSCVLLN